MAQREGFVSGPMKKWILIIISAIVIAAVVILMVVLSALNKLQEPVPDRLDKLEAEVLRLNKEIPDLVWKCYVSLYAVILRNQGWDEDKSRQEAINTIQQAVRSGDPNAIADASIQFPEFRESKHG